jgi:hypothetical protein
MAQTTLTWKLVDDTASQLGVNDSARLKWRQVGRGVPAVWRIKIVESLLARGVPVALGDFDRLEVTPGRIAA